MPNSHSKTRLRDNARWTRGALLGFALVSSLLACDADDGGTDPDSDTGSSDLDAVIAGANGVVAPPFDAHCVAIFKDAFDVQRNGLTAFTANAGSRYLLEYKGFALDDPIEAIPPRIYYLTAGTAIRFSVDSNAITTTCDADEGSAYMGALSDIELFADVERTESLCEVDAGTLWPATSDEHRLEASPDEEHDVYRIDLGLNGPCGDTRYAYALVQKQVLFQNTEPLIPIQPFIGLP